MGKREKDDGAYEIAESSHTKELEMWGEACFGFLSHSS